MVTLIVFKEKYGDSFYDASTPEKRAGAFLSVLRERAEAGYWYSEPREPETSFSDEERQLLALTDAEVAALPDALRPAIVEKRSRLNTRKIRATGEYKREKFWWDQLQELLALPEEEAIAKVAGSRRGAPISVAEDLIDYRADGEYEGYDIVETRN